jgi:hypothetical protein
MSRNHRAKQKRASGLGQSARMVNKTSNGVTKKVAGGQGFNVTQPSTGNFVALGNIRKVRAKKN